MGDWTEKYRPKTLDEVIGNEKALIELRKWASTWNTGIPKKRAVVLSGKPGNGKTSAALALAKDFGWISIELNTSDARNAAKIKSVATFGAVNETFTDDGRFISSLDGGRKLIILDEADNLYERVESDSNSNKDLSDYGGKKAIVETIKITNQPIILIVNDYYSLIKGSGEALKDLCKLIRFYDPYSSQVFTLLKRICLNERINIDQKVLKSIADRCKGDVRSAINDLQSISADRNVIDSKSIGVLGYRDREKDIFTALREIFKTKNIQTIRESITHLDADPMLVILWLNENLPKEYLDTNDLVKGYEALSKADIFLGGTRRKQNYSLWSYACDLMNGGVAVAKTHSYPNDSYNFPTWLRSKKDTRSKTDIKDIISKKLSFSTHNSNHKTKEYIYSDFTNIFRNNTGFAIKMKNKYDFSESEIKYLLGKDHNHKLKEIIAGLNLEHIEPIKEKKTQEKEEDKENIQQSLFDF
ncbi:MAG: replication factor C large subunit [Candidatus Lokiarchaeia archaeon]|nr:replication factor C large subunit [Candidatus Lokiarchaeia archaeon]